MAWSVVDTYLVLHMHFIIIMVSSIIIIISHKYPHFRYYSCHYTGHSFAADVSYCCGDDFNLHNPEESVRLHRVCACHYDE